MKNGRPTVKRTSRIAGISEHRREYFVTTAENASFVPTLSSEVALHNGYVAIFRHYLEAQPKTLRERQL